MSESMRIQADRGPSLSTVEGTMMTAAVLASDPKSERFSGRVFDSGEGRWTINAAVNEAVPVPTPAAALLQRFSFRGGAEFQDRLLSATRCELGGHVEKAPES